MKEKRLSLRLSAKRMYALQVYAASKEKSITAVIEDWIDETREKTVHSSSLREASLREASLREASPTPTPTPMPTTNISD
jgi:predicted DNA-binding ribbon-helix-helix protein